MSNLKMKLSFENRLHLNKYYQNYKEQLCILRRFQRISNLIVSPKNN